MTEVPEHLLQRSRDRRAALGLGGDGGDATPATAAATASASTAVAPAAASSPAMTSAPIAPVVKAPVFVPPYVQASERRQRVPMWAFPVLAFLPVWGIIYAQSLSAPPATTLTQLEAGAALYGGELPCAGCHGAAGAGGTGRKLSEGQVILTFPNIADQLEYVKIGDAGINNAKYGNPDRPGGQHGGGYNGAFMPAFKTLTDKELLEVVRHEREIIGKEDPTLFAVDPAGNRMWGNGKPMLNDSGKLVWDDGTAMFDATSGELTQKVDPTKPADPPA